MSLRPQGGMMDTPERIPPGFATVLQNMFYRNGSYVSRSGARLLNPTADTDRLAGIWGLKRTLVGATQWALVRATAGSASAAASFGVMFGSGFVTIPYNGVAAPVYDSANYWRQWREAITPSNEIFYVCRRQATGGRLFHARLNQITAAGIDAPPTPTVVGVSTLSGLAAGTYPVACRYVTVDGQYSPLSPIPATTTGGLVTILADEYRRWSLTKSTHPRVTGIELMIGYAGAAAGQVYFAYLAPNATATVDENVLDVAYDLARPGNTDLVVPPSNPEDCCIWDAAIWLLVNDPVPEIWHSYIDANGSSFETFDPSRVLGLPSNSGGKRYMAIRPWDRRRCAVLTDGSAHVLEPAGDQGYSFTDIDPSHGCVSPNAADVGAGLLCWYDGRNFLASDGGPGRIVSLGWVDKTLAQVPQAYAERALVKYTPDDGGAFWLCIPSGSSSTDNDLVLCWDTKQWHLRSYFAPIGARAPVVLNRIPSPEAQQYTVAGFTNRYNVIRLDSPVRRDEGPYNIDAVIETAEVEMPDGYATASVARVHVGVRRRPDTSLPDPGIPITASVSLRVNGVQTTPVSVTITPGTDYLHARAQNLGNPAERVRVVIELSHPDVLEVFDIEAEVTFYRREGGRT